MTNDTRPNGDEAALTKDQIRAISDAAFVIGRTCQFIDFANINYRRQEASQHIALLQKQVAEFCAKFAASQPQGVSGDLHDCNICGGQVDLSNPKKPTAMLSNQGRFSKGATPASAPQGVSLSDAQTRDVEKAARWLDGSMSECRPEELKRLAGVVRSLLSAPGQEGRAVPEGWKLVPVELPEVMRREGFAPSNGREGARALWRAMLAVAPAAPSQEVKDAVECSGDGCQGCTACTSTPADRESGHDPAGMMDALRQIAEGRVMTGAIIGERAEYTHADTVIAYQKLARTALARAATPPAQDVSPSSPEVKDAEGKDVPTDTERLHWLHSEGSNNVGGYEWGIYRVKWEGGRAAEVWATNSDFSDLDAAIASQKGSV